MRRGDESRAKRKRGWLPLIELSFSVYFLLAILYAIRMSMWGTIPFLFLFFFGFGYMGTMSLLQSLGGVAFGILLETRSGNLSRTVNAATCDEVSTTSR